jgi:hypothetical protein
MREKRVVEAIGGPHDRPARSMGGRLRRAVGEAPRTQVYPVLGVLLAVAVTVARLCEVGPPDDEGTKAA